MARRSRFVAAIRRKLTGFPWLEKDLRAAGIPCASIEIDQQNAGFEQIRTRVQTFCELL